MNLLHIPFGMSALGATKLPGRIEILHDTFATGPAVRGPTHADTRAHYWGGEERHSEYLALDVAGSARDVDEVVLWVTRNPRDQLNFIFVVHELSTLTKRPTVSIVEIDAHTDGYVRCSVGEVPRPELHERFETRRTLDDDEIARAVAAWIAWTDGDADVVNRLIHERGPQLPWLGAGLERAMCELPWTTDGLSQLERAVFRRVEDDADNCGERFGAAFDDDEESHYNWCGDAYIWRSEEALVTSAPPLMFALPWNDQGAAPFRGLTDEGRAVLRGEVDRCTLVGIDRWIGGFHAVGHHPQWRWDPQQRLIVSMG